MVADLHSLCHEFFEAKDISFTYAIGTVGQFEIIVGEELVHSKATDGFPFYPGEACPYVKVYDAIHKKGAKKKKGMTRNLLVEKATKWKPKKLSLAEKQSKLREAMMKKMRAKGSQKPKTVSRGKSKSPSRRKSKSPSRRTSKSPSQRKSSSRRLGSTKSEREGKKSKS
mmetsp:Transcript_34009/g.55193  ORF Transcript_34009/g.55193 Transcript_34009/m.55193 type:complete len:169 (+) Transcript_34009:179-685(+)